MISSAAAKVLFFIAISLAPKDAREIMATSNSENYFWSRSGHDWYLTTKGLPSEDWISRGAQENSGRDCDVEAIAAHRWTQHSGLDLGNGNRVEKQDDTAFYIIDPGAPNQKIFTILYSNK